ncbi:UNVERIFIED_CONTAM: hypothetical protein FKN15_049355 [Acipenser sinensis]
MRDWILENAGLEAKSMPVAIRILQLMDRERWEAYAREHTLSTWEEGVELVLSYLEAAITTTAAQVAGPPAEEYLLSPSPPAEGECLLSPSPPAEGECLLSPSPPAEGECLLSPSPPAEGECLLSPSPPAEGECLLSPSPPAEGECLLSPCPPAEGECLLVLPPQPKWEEPERPAPEWEGPERPAPEWEEPERPTPEWEEPERPTPEWEEPERPKPKRGESVHPQPKREESVRPQPKREESVRPQPKEGGVGASTALGPKQPAEGECLLVPPPLLPPQEPEGEELQAQPPEIFWGGEGQDAGCEGVCRITRPSEKTERVQISRAERRGRIEESAGSPIDLKRQKEFRSAGLRDGAGLRSLQDHPLI